MQILSYNSLDRYILKHIYLRDMAELAELTELPLDIIDEILSRMPLIGYISGRPNQPSILSFLHINELKEQTPETNSVMEFRCQKSLMVLGSCNGLLYLSQNHDNDMINDMTTLVVIDPLRKERYELPPIDIMLGEYFQESCGLCFDDSTNTFKMVCVVVRNHATWQMKLADVRKNLRTMVHVLGTNSWIEIPQVPDYPITGEGVFSHGYMYWLAACVDESPNNDPRKVIWFNVKKEEFGWIDLPKETQTQDESFISHRLVDLHGELGYEYMCNNIEVWVLKKKEWVVYCRVDQKPPFPHQEIMVLGQWNKKGDLLMTNNPWEKSLPKRLFVYGQESGEIHEVKLVGWENGWEGDIRMYQSSRFSIHG